MNVAGKNTYFCAVLMRTEEVEAVDLVDWPLPQGGIHFLHNSLMALGPAAVISPSR